MNQTEFMNELAKINININQKQLKMLEKYYIYLTGEAEKYNLTTIINKEDVYWKHFYDSLTIVRIIKLEKSMKVCDVGSGAGFPGVVLKIIFPKIELTLVEASGKKAKFLSNLCYQLDIKATIINDRAENMKNIEEFDLVVARAVASTPILLEITATIIKIGGNLVLYKSNISREIENLGNIDVGLKKINCITFDLPFEKGRRALFLFKKHKKTPQKYPRNYNLIKKKPIF